jgi:hypothetical protein
MPVRSVAGGVFFRVNNWDMYDSVTWAALARSLWSKPNCSSRRRITKETSTEAPLGLTITVQSRIADYSYHIINYPNKLINHPWLIFGAIPACHRIPRDQWSIYFESNVWLLAVILKEGLEDL